MNCFLIYCSTEYWKIIRLTKLMKVIFHKHFDCVRKIYYRKPVKASSEETWEINAPKFKPILLADPPEVHLLLSAANRHSNNKQRGVAAGLAERIFSATCFASERVARNLCKAAQLPNLWRIRICARHTLVLTRSQLVALLLRGA